MVGLTFLPRMACDDHLFVSVLLELAQRVILRLQCFDEGVPVAAEIFADDVVYPLLDEVIRDLKFLFLERTA